MPEINVNGNTLAFDDTGGSGPAVVLLHAGIADRRMWRHQLDALADTHRLIALDLPGYGDSAVPTTSFAHHDQVADLLTALDLDRVTLVGCSFGGAVALDTALAHPDRIGALALFGTAVSGHEWSDEMNTTWDALIGDIDTDDVDALAEAEVRFWVIGPGRQPDQVDPALRELAHEMDRRALAAEQALTAVPVRELSPPAIGRLHELRIPVLVAAGAADVPEIIRLADLICAAVPGATRLADVPGAGHLLPLEVPEPVNAALRGFLAG